ncbi:D-alanyl-D-alanine carboxypeptidase family protein [Euhalothece natronophila Z-M001]|uniref:D-alanyl-D-alanine carboxypeptidase family protein n=1 Tax=Euhalothece natronophila Z-M001 TaxID=522448 RepID=A0A5B8NI51_9CHRO|nr:M15 family metallopeptidase [Euhalothece natronophila]QDZ38648.1 D-alanyl-D-alanine carboxypeptidase family protein [Euhalothece natronophila Z-M001]
MSVRNNQTSPDEIPEAVRDVTPVRRRKRNSLRRGGAMAIGFTVIVVILGSSFWEPMVETFSSALETEETISEVSEEMSQEERREDLLGHFPYEEAPPESLTALSSGSTIKLRTPAAEKFVEMQEAAQEDGVSLVPLSGYRSVEEQEDIFFGVKAERGEVPRERAQVSAPPGYSEHHTGYAIDIGDREAPTTHFQEDFAKTEAFQWLEENAARYSFELSFPKDNPQGVSYEPWHWRYVGNQESLEIFYGN